MKRNFLRGFGLAFAALLLAAFQAIAADYPAPRQGVWTVKDFKFHTGQVLAVMEAMKMEHTIAAPGDGEVAELLFAPGDQVPEGAELLTLTAPGQ